jgi:hypothetical protein
VTSRPFSLYSPTTPCSRCRLSRSSTRGRTQIGGFLATVPAGGALERFRLVPTRANGQPAFGCWLLDLSELPEILAAQPVRTHLVHALVQLDRDYTAAQPTGRWEHWYASRLEGLLG